MFYWFTDWVKTGTASDQPITALVLTMLFFSGSTKQRLQEMDFWKCWWQWGFTPGRLHQFLHWFRWGKSSCGFQWEHEQRVWHLQWSKWENWLCQDKKTTEEVYQQNLKFTWLTRALGEQRPPPGNAMISKWGNSRLFCIQTMIQISL